MLTGKRLALSLAYNCPPDTREQATYPLCRQTGISHTCMLTIMSRCNGSYRLFLSEIGLKHHHVADNGYWLPLFEYCNYYCNNWERQLTTGLQALALLPDDERQAAEANLARILNMPLSFVQDWLPNADTLPQIIQDMKPVVMAKAHANVQSAIVNGDVKVSLEYIKMEAALAAANKDTNDNEVIIKYAD